VVYDWGSIVGRQGQGGFVHKSRRSGICIGLVVALALLAACASQENTAQYLYRQASVQTVRVETREPDPATETAARTPNVVAVVSGLLTESCAAVGEARQEFDGRTNTFLLTVTTRRPVGEPCEQGETPFETSVDLQVRGLPSGTYTVIANGITVSFELTAADSPML